MKRKNAARNALVTSILSLLLCVSMLVGTTFAWFTDEVVSGNNIIKSGKLDVEMYYGNSADAITNDASTGAIFSYELWEPGYTEVKYVKIANVGNLAFQFRLDIIPAIAEESKLAEVIDVYMFDATATVDRAAIAAATPVGTLAELMGDADGAAHGVLLPADGVGSTNVNTDNAPRGEIAYCIVLKMQESAGNEYQELSVGGGFKVQLLATQYTWEKDSFDHTYDENAEYNEAPKAGVTLIPEDKLNVQIPLYTYSSFQNTGKSQSGLDKGFTFTAPEDETAAEQNPYKWWHADFVVTFDKPIATGSAGLAGQYDFWGMDWVGFEAFDVDSSDAVDGIPADMACRLLEGKGVYINYLELCRDVKNFNCGVFNNDPANVGTTITVELRLYEVENDDQDTGSHNIETGNYIVVGTYTYTFE